MPKILNSSCVFATVLADAIVHSNFPSLAVAIGLACLTLAPGPVDGATSPEQMASRSAWRTQLQWADRDCPLEFAPEPDGGVDVAVLEPGRRVVKIECEHHAYQGTQLIYVQSGARFVPLRFVQFESEAPGTLTRYESPLLTGLVSFSPRDRTVRVLRKSRGSGDCGQYVVYVVKAQSAVLRQLRVRECPARFDRTVPAPESWPLKRHRG